jgi:hypothetical protein
MPHTPSADAARARFATATTTHLCGPLTDDVTLELVDVATWEQHNQALWDDAGDRGPAFDLRGR